MRIMSNPNHASSSPTEDREPLRLPLQRRPQADGDRVDAADAAPEVTEQDQAHVGEADPELWSVIRTSGLAALHKLGANPPYEVEPEDGPAGPN